MTNFQEIAKWDFVKMPKFCRCWMQICNNIKTNNKNSIFLYLDYVYIKWAYLAVNICSRFLLRYIDRCGWAAGNCANDTYTIVIQLYFVSKGLIQNAKPVLQHCHAVWICNVVTNNQWFHTDFACCVWEIGKARTAYVPYVSFTSVHFIKWFLNLKP